MAIDLTMHSFFEYVGELKGMLIQAQEMLKKAAEEKESLEAQVKDLKARLDKGES